MGISSKNDNTFLTMLLKDIQLHFLFQFGSSNKLVRQIDKGDCETLPPALKIVQQLQFVLPVDFAYLPFHPIALYSPFETPLRNADQYRGGCFPLFYGHIYNTYRKDGKRLGIAAFEHLSDPYFTIQPFGFTQSIYAHSVYLLFSLINMSSAAVIEGACTVGASRSRRSPASRTACAVVDPKVPILISF